ncbi:Tigger transposable element-derived protein 7-like 26 [Homarus americanus]|uniref:Tigger transposable element-derived protein 7-like 26 n=1 Tax=Homarus americanus TaxID=6706 RepID=A0A8J5KJG8_HOMAM|nr:Tigger transposable element-derived protein 7-like 26 [Homarus americanus]
MKRAAGVPVRGIDLQSVAERFTAHLNIEDSRPTEADPKSRSHHCLSNKIVVGESRSADVASVEPFRKKLLALIDKCLLRCQLYNGDETGLYWKSVPENTQAAKSEGLTPGRKTSKECVSALACGNADGSHRLKPMIISTGLTNDYMATLQRGGEAKVKEDNLVDWLAAEAEEPGYHHQTEDLSHVSEDLQLDGDKDDKRPAIKLE